MIFNIQYLPLTPHNIQCSSHTQLKRARESEAIEMAAALEAAGVATSSALRRAELEEETDGMIEALINR